MKRIVFIFLSLVIALQVSLAQRSKPVIVVFPNGNVQKGEIARLPNDKRLRLQTLNGSVLFFYPNEVRRITYEDGSPVTVNNIPIVQNQQQNQQGQQKQQTQQSKSSQQQNRQGNAQQQSQANQQQNRQGNAQQQARPGQQQNRQGNAQQQSQSGQQQNRQGNAQQAQSGQQQNRQGNAQQSQAGQQQNRQGNAQQQAGQQQNRQGNAQQSQAGQQQNRQGNAQQQSQANQQQNRQSSQNNQQNSRSSAGAEQNNSRSYDDFLFGDEGSNLLLTPKNKKKQTDAKNKESKNKLTDNTGQSDEEESFRMHTKGMIELGYTFGMGNDFSKKSRFEGTLSYGLQVTPGLFIGAGTGVHFFGDSIYMKYDKNNASSHVDSTYSNMLFPIFLDMRYNFSTGNIVPFAGLKVGYGIGLVTKSFEKQDANGNRVLRKEMNPEAMGLYLSPSAGAKFILGRSLAFNISLAYTMQMHKYEVSELKIYRSESMSGVTLRLGLEF